jgi:hypothetical protein
VTPTIDWTAIITQVPLVAVFIWYSLEMNKRYNDAQSKRDEAYIKAMSEIASCLQAHDRRVDGMSNRLDDILERVKPVGEKTQPRPRTPKQ